MSTQLCQISHFVKCQQFSFRKCQIFIIFPFVFCWNLHRLALATPDTISCIHLWVIWDGCSFDRCKIFFTWKTTFTAVNSKSRFSAFGNFFHFCNLQHSASCFCWLQLFLYKYCFLKVFLQCECCSTLVETSQFYLDDQLWIFNRWTPKRFSLTFQKMRCHHHDHYNHGRHNQ